MRKRILTTAALLATNLILAGCGNGNSWIAGGNEPPPAVTPDDFIGNSQADASESIDTTALIRTETKEETADTSAQTTAESRTDLALPIDAMVGHINGEAVYADQIFDVNLVAQLESFGRRFDREAFGNAASGVIQDKLQGIIINKLILGEAERNLQEAQRRGIEGRIQAEREELLRFYGQGSLAKAKAEFKKERGKELEQHLIAFREELVIGSYVRSKVMPKIVVNQRDVERYYADNIEKYQQPDQRVVRLIRVTEASVVDEIDSRLNKGESFKNIAADPSLNNYNPDNGGIFNGGDPVPGNKVIGIESVNNALLKLETGGHAGPIKAGDNTFYVQVVELTPGVKIELADAQIKIESILRSTQFEKHALRFRVGLLRRGSYSDPAQMGQKLLDIAFARYDR